jgi:hypothetical protein
MHCGECGVSPLDLMIAGNQALLDSVASYARATHGASFSAHATPHIVKALSETVMALSETVMALSETILSQKG